MNGPEIAQWLFVLIALLIYYDAHRRGDIMDTFLLASTLVSTIVLGGLGLWLQHRGNQHFSEQNRIMIEQMGASRRSKTDKDKMLAYKPPRWPMIVMAVMVVVVWTAVAVNYLYVRRPFDPNKAWDDKAPLKQIYHRTFMDETVPLDGYYYHDCVFDNVTLEYEGKGGVGLDNIHFVLHNGRLLVRVASKDKVVTQAFKLNTMLDQVAGCGTVGIMDLGPTGNIHSIPPR